MKKTNKILSLIFALVLGVSCVAGCKKEETPSQSGNVYLPSGYNLVERGVSEYTVVIPATPDENEYTAAQELQYFLKEATGAQLNVVEEDDYSIAEGASVISIGDTIYAEEKGVTTDGQLGLSGYVMKTLDNQLFIRSDGDGLGCIYAVYDLLESAIGYRYYYTDEIYYEEKDTVDLYKYDVVKVPSFDFRTLSTWNKFLHTNEDYMLRMRTFRLGEGWAWTGQMHCQNWDEGNGILPHKEWGALHSFGATKTVEIDGEEVEVADHWYSETGDQLCWTAGEEMYEEAAADIINRIQMEPTKTYFPCGQADVTLFCNCERCQDAKEEWAMNDAGLQIHFINRVASYVNEWIAENCPEREIRLAIFAYYATETPPAVKDANGKWVYCSEQATLQADNVDIYLAPIYSDYSKPLEDVANETVYSNLQKWNDLLEGTENRFLLWTYDTNFHYFFYNFNNFDTFAEHARTYEKYGVSFYHSQGANNNNQPGFPEMRYFVESQILWDTSKDYDELVNEFMGQFYKDAAPEIREYYDFIRMRYEQAIVLQKKELTGIYSDIGSKEIWTEGVVDEMDRIFKKAYAKIEHYKTDDSAMYEKLFNRIKVLEMTLIYIKLKDYPHNYTQTEKNSLVDEFNTYVTKFDMNRVKEGGAATLGLFDSLKK